MSAIISNAINNPIVDLDTTSGLHRTELDSHANMVVLGRHARVVSHSNTTVRVNAFTPEHAPIWKPVVDAVVAYHDEISRKTYILMFHNSLLVKEMDHNLIPPFIMREAGLLVNDVPKIHCHSPTKYDHSIQWPGVKELLIPLKLHGIFSYFPTQPCPEFGWEGNEKVLHVTPQGPAWDPNSDHFAKNEENLVDYEGEIVQTPTRIELEIPEYEYEAINVSEVSVENVMNDAIRDAPDLLINEFETPSMCLEPPMSIEGKICSLYDDDQFLDSLMTRDVINKYIVQVGSTDVSDDEWFVSNLDEIEIGDVKATGAKGVSADHLSKIWRISLQEAESTIKGTRQLVKHTNDPTLSRQYTTNDRMLRYPRINEYFFMDVFYSTTRNKRQKGIGTSKRGNSCMALFISDKGFVFVVAMKDKSETHMAIRNFTKAVGAPDALIVDPAGENTSAKVRAFCYQIGTTLRSIERGTQWANKAELYIGLFKKSIQKDLMESNAPLVFWDYAAERRAMIMNLTFKDSFKIRGTNTNQLIKGDPGDISNLCTFGFWDWCVFREDTNQFPFAKEELGKVLGPAVDAGNMMAQWVCKSNGQIVPRRTLRRLTTAEVHSDVEIERRKVFLRLMEKHHGTSHKIPVIDESSKTPIGDDDGREFELYEDAEETPRSLPEADSLYDSKGRPLLQQPSSDRLINSEVLLPQGRRIRSAKVLKRTEDDAGELVGTYSDNPMLNTCTYDVMFPDGEVKQYAANIIAENLFAQVDPDGHSHRLMEGIVGHKMTKDAVRREDKHLVTKFGARKLRKTTVGWKLLVSWKDGSESWIPLKDLKESNPVDVADYATKVGIADEAAFAWWVPFTLRKRDVIISLVKARVVKRSHKYGVEIPRTVKEALALDEKNGNTFWAEAIKKEMFNVGIAFEILDDDQHIPPGWKENSAHLVFDVKMDFTRKARFVFDGHKTQKPAHSTYAGVVSRESVRIALTLAALNDIPVWSADILNAYLQAPSSEKYWIRCGPEFGLENVGKRALIRRALYGGKSAGRDFRNHLRMFMSETLKFEPCPSDPDVWIRPAKRSNGEDYYEYVLLYVDDCLVISENAERILRKEIGDHFALKPESIMPPSQYLGGRLSSVTLDNGQKAWSFSPSQYVQEAVRNVENYLAKLNKKLTTNNKTPMVTSYRPELDVSPILEGSDAAYYQSLIGILRWIVELGRVDICLEVSMMSSMLAMPRQGHLENLFQIFAYLKKYHNAEMVFDPSLPDVDMNEFTRKDWTASEQMKYEEELPGNMITPRGLGFRIIVYVDADHAGDTITRRSRTGFIVFLNKSPIYWMSKKQNSVETSSFGSEFMAMKHCCEYVRGLRIKLRLMGIPCEEPTFIFGDNQSVLCNTAQPDSTLKKKSNSIAYHFVREGVARDEWRTSYVNTNENPADLFTKMLVVGKREHFVRMLLHHIFRT